MDPNRSGANLLKMWADTQQKLLTNWLDTVRRFGGTPSMEVWRQTVEAWEKSVKETLDAQAQWSRDWTATLNSARGTPEELSGLIQQGQEQLQRWIVVQQQLWQGWFDIVKSINLAMEPGTGAQAGQNLLQIWQDATYKMINAQTTLVRQWTTDRTDGR